ncbi:MAG: NADAR family protein, partial [Lachnospiraceae bacterium]|nr:NADAR family protein [Lachnospiraceae bacterium]
MVIKSFRGEHRFLSNFYQFPFEYEGLTYPNSEAAFQAQKCIDPADRMQYTQIKNPLRVKQMGKREQLRPDWGEVSYDIMDAVLHQKFA